MPSFWDFLTGWLTCEEAIVSQEQMVFYSELLRCIFITPKKEMRLVIGCTLGYRLAIRFNSHNF
jgi:hypothetical protein